MTAHTLHVLRGKSTAIMRPIGLAICRDRKRARSLDLGRVLKGLAKDKNAVFLLDAGSVYRLRLAP